MPVWERPTTSESGHTAFVVATLISLLLVYCLLLARDLVALVLDSSHPGARGVVYSSAGLDPAFEALTRMTVITALLALWAWSIAIFAFCLWEYRMSLNLPAISPGVRLRFAPGAVVLWWFVPVMNLWRPYQVMREIWQVVAPGDHSRTLLIGWWASCLGSAVAGTIVLLSDLVDYNDPLHALSHIVHVLEIVITMLLVRRLSRREDLKKLARYKRLASTVR